MQQTEEKEFEFWFNGEKEWGFEITKGSYAGTVVQIEHFTFPEEGNELSVDYHNIKMPDGLTEESYKTDEFNSLMTTVFETLIKKVLDEYERDKRRESNPTESDPQ